ncbi:hypothetical protein HPB47_001448 [Ixodes persulcatus]|uniref:Uncharacterized protein n=1 Tax=Ixodes persulcatus TaxID=34615 RepID=A0AC60PQA6_IXOPE|nr:hypothetical protein HPB47_001448 [Ixodes persulcatus]
MRQIESASDEESRKKAIVALGLTVIFAPQDPTILLNKINGLKLTEDLNSHAPTEVGEIRCNKRFNILAVDTRNQESTACLLRIRKLVGIAVREYAPRNWSTAVGIIRDVDAGISEKVLLRNLSANRTKITQVCTRCSGSHASERCEAERAKCVNCKGAHEATSKDCVIWQQERAVNKYKAINKVDFRTARAAIRSRGQHNIEQDNQSNASQNETRSSHPARRASSNPESASREQGTSREQRSTSNRKASQSAIGNEQLSLISSLGTLARTVMPLVTEHLKPFDSPVVRAILYIIPLVQHRLCDGAC